MLLGLQLLELTRLKFQIIGKFSQSRLRTALIIIVVVFIIIFLPISIVRAFDVDASALFLVYNILLAAFIIILTILFIVMVRIFQNGTLLIT